MTIIGFGWLANLTRTVGNPSAPAVRVPLTDAEDAELAARKVAWEAEQEALQQNPQ